MYLPVGLRKLYDVRASHILPFSERTKLILCDSDLNDVHVKVHDSFSFPPWDILQFSFLNLFTGTDKSSNPPIIFQQLFLHHHYKYSSFIPVFTDGSRSDGHVGCAIVTPSETVSYRLHNYCSVFTAELVAIFYAPQKISPSTQRNFIIYSDSMSALKTLSNYHYPMHPIAVRILFTLRLLQNDGFNIILCWVPGHVGIFGNEKADLAAKSATEFLRIGLSFSDVKTSVFNHTYSSWQETWNLQVQNKLRSIKPIISLWPVLPIREKDVKLTRLRIGHTRLTHRHLILREKAATCPTCQLDFTVYHILVQCPAFNSHRIRFFHSLSLTLADLVGENYHPNIFNFLKAIQLYIHI
ncbi:uncharacterized protein LOC129975278 [Argiope bruennichi]|uniref:uncharacterized protein LOC129975278 n=1 Tax=Argiope bruennichi TaxID=94029 RepID=UPI0024954119|nr:uncharacterized protein LOC129975278 [Argiope bruennichi]